MRAVAICIVWVVALTVNATVTRSEEQTIEVPLTISGISCVNVHMISPCAWVVDSETIAINRKVVRIAGIDAPQSTGSKFGLPQCKEEEERGNEAFLQLLKIFGAAKEIEVQEVELDSDGRMIAKVSVNGKDVGRAMRRSGNAVRLRKKPKNWCN